MFAFALQKMKTKYRRTSRTQAQGYMDLAKPESGALDCNNRSYWKKIRISKKDRLGACNCSAWFFVICSSYILTNYTQ